MKLVHHIPPVLRNKYLLTVSVFVVWMIFFDKNDLFTQLERNRNLKEIEKSKDYYAQKIAESKKFSQDIQSNAAAIEKFAREKYLMKRENEDLFLIQKPEKQE
ncbi:MAG TPA: septum formation initiator family protein [Flavisolibacter sp.]|nr:septum formation initiator family protein [Flavisolibacter sp.]